MNFPQYKEFLAKLVGFKSISTDPAYQEEIHKTANYLVTLFEGLGFTARLITGTKTNPYVFAEYHKADQLETVLIYGHYDVAVAEKEQGWNTDPFTVSENNDRLVGRGVVDNKGQLLIHVAAVAELIKNGSLAYNVKFLIEGNEETGNSEIREIIKKNLATLKANFVLISDGEMAGDKPTIDAGFRGGANITLKFKTANNSLHSGIYGGAVPNAAHELAIFVGKLYDEKNRVGFAEFYDDVVPPTKGEVDNNKLVGCNFQVMNENTGVKTLKLEPGLDFPTQTGLRPMLTVTGFKSGYVGEGYNNSIPPVAEAKINFRFVCNQDPDKILRSFENFVTQEAPGYVDFEIVKDSNWKATKIATDTPRIDKARARLLQAYKVEPVFKFVGGSIPVVADFIAELGVEVISISMGNEDCNMHGTNENFEVSLIEKGLVFSETFLGKSA